MPEQLSTILNKVRENNWAGKLSDIEEYIKNFDDKRKNPSGNSEENLIGYLNEILPTYWDVFHTHNTHRRKTRELPKRDDNDETLLPIYHIGIFLVGYSSLPIALSLAEIQPTEQIYFLYSSETQEYLDEISNRLSAMLNGSNEELLELVKNAVPNNRNESALADPSDPVATFKRIKEIIDNIDKSEDKRIALDLTGGKKTMIGGGFTAGAIWASRWSAAGKELVPFCDMYYIDSKDYDPTQGRPKAGTEFLSKLDNPYDVYNVQSVQQAEKLFEKHNYDAAADLWNSVHEKLSNYAILYGLENEHETVKKNLYRASCYGYWDAFDYIAAKDSKENYGTQWDYDAKHRSNQVDVLEILSEVEDTMTLFSGESRIIHYAVDYYKNGIRRMDSDRVHDATVRFTKVVEILCRYQIYKIAEQDCLTDNNHTPVSVQCCLDEHWRISELIHFLFRQHWRYDYDRFHIANENMRLNIDDYGYTDTDDIINFIAPRHEFVHGENTPGWAEMNLHAINLKSLARKFLENFYERYYPNQGLSFDDLLELHRFRQ